MLLRSLGIYIYYYSATHLKVQNHLYLKWNEVKVYFSMWVRLVDVRPKSQFIKRIYRIRITKSPTIFYHYYYYPFVRSKSSHELSKFSGIITNVLNEFWHDKTRLEEPMRRAKSHYIFFMRKTLPQQHRASASLLFVLKMLVDSISRSIRFALVLFICASVMQIYPIRENPPVIHRVTVLLLSGSALTAHIRGVLRIRIAFICSSS